jgi:hypothetical protein
MSVLCIQKREANQPICATHNVALVRTWIPIDSFAPDLGRVTCYQCPVSGAVVQEERETHARYSF